MRLLAMLIVVSGCGVFPAERSGTTEFFGAGDLETTASGEADERIINHRGWLFGAWVDLSATGETSRAGFGYREINLTEAPLTCGVIIFVESEEQLQQALEMSKDLFQGGEKPCVTQR